MDTKEIFVKLSEMLERFGIKEALKNQTVVDTIYDVMSKHGMKVDKLMFSMIAMTIANTPADKFGDIINLVSSFLAGNAQQGQGANNPLGTILGATQNQSQTKPPEQDINNPLGAILGSLVGLSAQQQAQSQSTNQQATAADLLGGLAKVLNQK